MRQAALVHQLIAINACVCVGCSGVAMKGFISLIFKRKRAKSLIVCPHNKSSTVDCTETAKRFAVWYTICCLATYTDIPGID
jgi:hypothetical protein